MQKIEPLGRATLATAISGVTHVALLATIAWLTSASTARPTTTLNSVAAPEARLVFVASKAEHAFTTPAPKKRPTPAPAETAELPISQPPIAAHALESARPVAPTLAPHTTLLDKAWSRTEYERTLDTRWLNPKLEPKSGPAGFDRVRGFRAGNSSRDRAANGTPGPFDTARSRPRTGGSGGGNGGGHGDGGGDRTGDDFDGRTPANVTVPPKILAAPRPEYTEDARNRRVHGETSFDVIFLSTGKVQVLSIRQRLEPDLDRRAEAAVLAIKFEPARRNGEAVSYPTTVHVLFRLLSIDVEVKNHAQIKASGSRPGDARGGRDRT